NEGLEAGAWLALGLHGTVVIALVEGEATDQCLNGAAVWVERDQRTLRRRDLSKAQAAVLLALDAHDIADLGDVAWLLRAWAEAIGIEEGTRPFHAVPGHGLFFAVAVHDQDAALLDLGNHRRFKAADAAELAQLGEPGFACQSRQTALGTAIAVALIVGNQPVAQRNIGHFLQVAGD